MDNDCRLLFDNMPGAYLILQPDVPHFTIVAYNSTLIQIKKSVGLLAGQKLFEAFSIDDLCVMSDADLTASITDAITTKKPQKMPVHRYDQLNLQTNTLQEKYWSHVNIPVVDNDGQVKYIIHTREDVTDKILLQEKGKKNQQELTYLHEVQYNILESIEDAFISTDRNWIIKYWNKQAESIFNFNREEVLGKTLWEFVKIDVGGKLHDTLVNAMKSNKPAHFEEYYAPMDIWLQVNAYPSVDGLTAVLVNVTEKKKAEEDIRKSEQRFRALIENISDGLIVISPKGIIRELSISAQKLLGFDFKYFKGQNYKYLFFSADLPEVEKAFQDILKLENIWQFNSYFGKNSSYHQNALRINMGITVQFRFIKHGGGIRWMEGNFHNLLHEETIRSVVFTFRDITTRREQEKQLQASEEKYRYLFQSSPAAIIIWTLEDYWIREVNETACLLYGFTRNEFLMMTFLDLKAMEQEERVMNMLSSIKQEHSLWEGTWQHKTKYGDIIYMNISFHRINYGGMDAVLTLCTNVTENILLQKKLEEERQQRQKEITEAVLNAQENEREELGRELHDNISQILTTARMYIEHSFSRQEKQKDLLQQSREYISKAIREIRQISHKLMPPSLSEISLKQSLEELFINLKGLSNFKFKFEYSIADERNLSNELKLTIFRIIQEGLNNVFRHSKATEIFVHVEQKESDLVVCIEDNGIGFDVKRKSRGLGLRNITSRANLFGGKIELNSQLDKGTELKVLFPLDNK